MIKKEYTEKGWRYPVDTTRHHRENDWDYHGRAIYHITLVVAERKHLFGELMGDSAETARIELNKFGTQVYRKLHDLPQFYLPKGYELKMLAIQVMPDHLHFVIYAMKPLPKHIGAIVRGFKSACTSIYKRIYFGGDNTIETDKTDALSSPVFAQFSSNLSNNGSIWEKMPAGYHERILHAAGQLQNMINYVHDNPRRLWLKKKHPKNFAVQRNVRWKEYSFDAVGNLWLMDTPMHAVHVRRGFSEEKTRTYMNQCILAARQGAALVGAFISPKEKQVLEVAIQEELLVIYLVPHGFSDYYKPSGNLMNACAKGKMLFLTDSSSDVHPHHSISREECNRLNAIAEVLAGS